MNNNFHTHELARMAADLIGMVGFHNIPTEFTKQYTEILVSVIMVEIRDELKFQSNWKTADKIFDRINKKLGILNNE
jgi:hypothetical protein